MLLLLSCVIIAGITTEGSPVTHHAVKSSSICLQVGNASTYEDATWAFNTKVIVFQKKVVSNTGKMNYNPWNNTLCIHKLAETDIGDYTVTIAYMKSGDFILSSETHRIIVEEAVPTPLIRMSVIGSNISAGSCMVSVNCSVKDEWLWTVCDEDSCRTNQSSLSKFSISVSADNRSVYCSGQNLVSASNVSARMDQTCHRKISIEIEKTSPASSMRIIGFAVAAVIAVCAFISCLIKGLSLRKCDQCQTPSAPLIHSQPTEDQPEPLNRSSTSSSQPDAAYENVDVTLPSQMNNPTSNPREELGSADGWTVATVYSVLQLPKAASPLENRDGDNNPQEASTSASGIHREAEDPSQVNTVYSVLKKPK